MNLNRQRFLANLTLCVLTWACCALPMANVLAQSEFFMWNRWEVDPPLSGIWQPVNTNAPLYMDVSRLQTGDVQSQLDEMRRIIKYSDAPQVEGKEPVCEYLLQRLRKGEDDRLLRQATLTILGKFGNADIAPGLWEIAKSQSDVRYQVEQILVQWKSQLPLSEWRQRLEKHDGTLQELLLAVEGIEAVNMADDVTRLESCLRLSGLPLAAKIPVARALGRIASSGLESFAEEVLSSNHQQRELIAANLLARHASERASKTQQQLVQSSNDAVASIAFASLSEAQPEIARELAISLSKHRDFRVRDIAIKVLSRYSDEKEIRAMFACLDDENMKLRDQAREFLFRKAEIPETKSIITELLTQSLQSPKSVAVEQAIILSVQWKLHERCDRLLELLDHPEVNVRIRAGWGLQELANDPKTVHAVYAYTQPLSQKLSQGEFLSYGDVFKLTHLLHVFGINNFKQAEPMLRLYVPEQDQRMNPIARTAAIWSLGILLEGTKDQALCEQLKERFLDLGPPSEYENVRYACAISMGRIAGMKETAFFDSTGEKKPYKVAEAAAWAIDTQAKTLSGK